ncbi:MAG: NADH-quinone oxidoreductase subunit L [Ignavibacteria bacterium]|jgi:NADH-quinone oxidoreductase subunit L|nr:NADH-quinone oxidoreductase subunit L [Ignavibacteria bacterium]MDH7528390.1 NADH-quinone oxidoreductase subunit L [Ignavibacteria bacterium]NPV10491.1 NADH-quinone oxidoreductase subunit L [Ignavibacteria bacterium]
MNDNLLLQLSILNIVLPLFGFTLLIFFGKRIPKSHLFEITTIFIGLVISAVVAFFKLSYYETNTLVFQFQWIDFGDIPFFGKLGINLGIQLDNVSAIMQLTVFIVSFVVHLFSIKYMEGDPRYSRYFAYLGLFTFSMLGIVLTHNFLMMYIFWELVGLSSYLLIGFWFEKKSASDAAKKAFIVNRIGDVGFFLGILILYANYHTFTFSEIFDQISRGNLPFNSGAWLTAAGILIFCGAIGKSAQFPLHVWLPDAMEGPTPVSALIHAATMVAAGVYLVARIFVMLTADAMLVIASIGAITAFISATIAITQTDIKRVLAYSTVSQLGYMIMSLGVGAYFFAFLHLITHAFFKAGLFLGSGSVIHAMHHEQDIRFMGGLRKKLPVTYYTFLIYTLAISGIPLTSGFLSKDGILGGTLAFASLTGYWIFPIIGFFVAMLTAFYMFRLVILTFHGEPRDIHKFEHAHESPTTMLIPLITLAILSIFIFFSPNPFNIEAGWFYKWVQTPKTIVPEELAFSFMKPGNDQLTPEVVHSEKYMEALHHAHSDAMMISLIMAGLGILLAFVIYQWRIISADNLALRLRPLYNFSYNKWYFDELYQKTAVAFTLGLSNLLAWFDQKVIDGIVNGTATITRETSFVSGKFDNVVVDGLVNLTAAVTGFFGLIFRKLQTGKVQTYLVMVLTGIIILFFIFKSL